MTGSETEQPVRMETQRTGARHQDGLRQGDATGKSFVRLLFISRKEVATASSETVRKSGECWVEKFRR